MQKVFMSYNHNDKDFANKLKTALEAEDIDVTIDIESMKFADNIQDFIEKSIRENDITISVISQNSLKSSWVMMETLESFMYEKVEQKKRFIPIFIDQKLFEDEFLFDVVDEIDERLAKLQSLTTKASQRNLSTAKYDSERSRLTKLRANIGDVLAELNNMLVADFSSDESFERNLPTLVTLIKDITSESLDTGKKDEYEITEDDDEIAKLYKEKLKRLKKAYALETDPARKFQIENQIKETERDWKNM